MLRGIVLMTDLKKERRLLGRIGWSPYAKAKFINHTERKMQPWKNYRLQWSL